MTQIQNWFRLRGFITSTAIFVAGSADCYCSFPSASQTEASTQKPGDRLVQPQAPTSKEEAQLEAVAKKLRPGMMSLVTRDGFVGNGFVISRKHRLVVTAGHVADELFGDGSAKAFCNGTVQSYVILRMWYHPRVERGLDGPAFSFSLTPDALSLSQIPGDGPIQTPRFDLAVLQLSGDGPELPVELELALDDELLNTEGRLVGSLAYTSALSLLDFGVD
jgi:hypothetical protein